MTANVIKRLGELLKTSPRKHHSHLVRKAARSEVSHNNSKIDINTQERDRRISWVSGVNRRGMSLLRGGLS